VLSFIQNVDSKEINMKYVKINLPWLIKKYPKSNLSKYPQAL
jgi:hypothetical protein